VLPSPALPRRCLFGALLLAGAAPARAQVTAAPESLRVVLPQGQEATVSVTITNGGAAPVPFCLDFDRPLQRSASGSLGVGCSPPGEVLAVFDEANLGGNWDPHGITMTPDGRVFLAEYARGETFEFTADLELVSHFPHPSVNELGPFPRTDGVTYNADTGTLWWTNAEVSGLELHRIMLLEGTLGGKPTGRRIELPIPPGPPPTNSGYPKGAAYDPAAARFYYVDGVRQELWAVDTLGVVPPGYPVRLARYPSAYVGNGVDAHGAGGGVEGVRLEVLVGLQFDNQYDRVVVTDAAGRNLGAETPLTALTSAQGGPAGSSVRSRVDPNGVVYVPYFADQNYGVAAVRPIPLAPTWLALSAWSGIVEAGQSAEVAVTFQAGERAPGEYRATLVVEDTAGVVLASVSLVLEVTPGTPAEPVPGAGAGPALSVAPNPVTSAAAVTLSLARPSPVRLAVYDVLGREVAVLHDGPLGAGAHTLTLGAVLPAGVYVVRAGTDEGAAAVRLTVAGR
jgi:hypothetical protein